jgi:hypothetical protein
MHILIPFIIFLFAFIIHKYLITPLEVLIISPDIINHASFLYLPHAVRIISYYILGPIALIPIFLSQCFTFIFINNAEFINTILLSSISTLSLYLGFRFYDLIKNDNIFNISIFVDWKKIIIIGILVSLFNSTLSSFYLKVTLDPNHFHEIFNLTYLVGDIMGLVFGMFIFILTIKFFSRWRSNNVRN